MSKDNTHTQTTDARSTDAGPRLPPLRRVKPSKPSILAGVGRSDACGRQDGGEVQVIRLSHRTIDAILEGESSIGPKSDCRCFYAGKPRLTQHIDAAKKANVESVSLGWMDLDGCVRGPEDLERVREYLRGLGGYNLHTSASHDPLGAHPKAEKRGGWRLRAFYFFAEALSYDEYKRVNTLILAGLARALGHTIASTRSKDIRRELVPLGIDPASCRGMQPAYLPRWSSDEVAAQAWREYQEGPRVDVGALLVAARAEIAEEEAAAAAARAPRVHHGELAPVDAGELAPVESRVKRFRRYLDSLGPARVGGGGHQLGWDACLAAWGLALELEEAWPEIERWNATCDLERRVSRGRLEAAYRDATTPRGWMLAARIAVAPCVNKYGVPQGATANAASAQTAVAPCVYKEGVPQGATSAPPPFQPPAGAHTRRLNTRYLPAVSYADLPRVSYVRSDCGTGKTTMMEGPIREVIAAGGVVVVLGPRTLLLQGHAQRYGLACYQDIRTKEIRESVAVTVHSSGRVETLGEDDEGLPRRKKIDLLFIDESEQCARDLFGGTILGAFRLDEVSSSSNDLLRIAEKAVLADTHLGEHTIAWVRDAMRWSPEEALRQEHWLINDFHRAVEVTEYTGEGERTAYRRQVDTRVCERLETPQEAAPVANYFAIKSEAKARVEDLRAAHPGLRAYLVDADTAGDPTIAHLLRDPARWSEVADYVAFTGALGLGFDLLGSWHVFGDLKAGGGPGDKACLQGMERCRDAQKWTVHTSGRPKAEETTAAGWLAKLSRKTPQTISMLRGVSSWESFWGTDGVHRLAHDRPNMVKRYAAVKADEARGAYLCDLVDEDGNTLKHGAFRTLCTQVHGYVWRRPSAEDLETTDAEDKAHTKRATAAAVTVKEAREEGISTSEDLTDEEAEEARKLPKTQAVVWALEKRRIKKQYNVDEVTPDFVERDDKGRHYQRCKAFAEMEAWSKGEREIVLSKDHESLLHGGILACRHKGMTAALRHALTKAILGSSWDAATEDGCRIKPLEESRLTGEIRLMIRDYLGLRGDPTTVQFAASVLRQIGLKTRSKAHKEGDTVIREYFLDAGSLSIIKEDSRAYADRLRGKEVRPKSVMLAEFHAIGIHPEDWDSMLETLLEEAA